MSEWPDFSEPLKVRFAYQCPDCFLVHLLTEEETSGLNDENIHECDCGEAVVPIDLRVKAINELRDALEDPR